MTPTSPQPSRRPSATLETERRSMGPTALVTDPVREAVPMVAALIEDLVAGSEG